MSYKKFSKMAISRNIDMLKIDSICVLAEEFLKIARSKDPEVRAAETKKQMIDRIRRIMVFGNAKLFESSIDVLEKVLNTSEFGNLYVMISDIMLETSTDLERIKKLQIQVTTSHVSFNSQVRKILNTIVDDNNLLSGGAGEKLNTVYAILKSLSDYGVSHRIRGMSIYSDNSVYDIIALRKSCFATPTILEIVETLNTIKAPLDELSKFDVPTSCLDLISDVKQGIDNFTIGVNEIVSIYKGIVDKFYNYEYIYDTILDKAPNFLNKLHYMSPRDEGPIDKAIYYPSIKPNDDDRFHSLPAKYHTYLLKRGFPKRADKMGMYLQLLHHRQDLTNAQLDKLLDFMKHAEWLNREVFWRNAFRPNDMGEEKFLTKFLDSDISNLKEFVLISQLDNNVRKFIYKLSKEYSLKITDNEREIFVKFLKMFPETGKFNETMVKNLFFGFFKEYDKYRIWKYERYQISSCIDTIETYFDKETPDSAGMDKFMMVLSNVLIAYTYSNHLGGFHLWTRYAMNNNYLNNYAFIPYIIYSKLDNYELLPMSDMTKLNELFPEQDEKFRLFIKDCIVTMVTGKKMKMVPECNEYAKTFIREITTKMDRVRYKEYYDKAKEKVPEIFNLDCSAPNYYFKALEFRDAMALKIGSYTNCCQSLGDAGANAAIDSYINSYAGTLVMYDKSDNILAQSYFHYIPDDKGYILDNVESNRKNLEFSGVDINKAYAELGLFAKNKYDVGYFRCGLSYNKLSSSKFVRGSDSSGDKRHFETEQYSDYSHDSFLDLLSPVGYTPTGVLK